MKWVSAGVVVCAVVLSGCAGVGTPASSTATPAPTPTATQTAEPTDSCTPVGGKRLEAVPVNDTANATPSDALTDAERETFLRMRNRTVELQYPIPDLPRHVRHDGTVYEIVVTSLWDGCE